MSEEDSLQPRMPAGTPRCDEAARTLPKSVAWYEFACQLEREVEFWRLRCERAAAELDRSRIPNP